MEVQVQKRSEVAEWKFLVFQGSTIHPKKALKRSNFDPRTSQSKCLLLFRHNHDQQCTKVINTGKSKRRGSNNKNWY